MEAERDASDDLRQWLNHNRGSLDQKKDELVHLLTPVWSRFAGANQEGMQAYKLQRLEAPNWSPPILSFTVERHGGIVAGGSTRAEIQEWTCNLDDWLVQSGKAGWRQIRPPQPRLKVVEIACEIAQAVTKQDKADIRLTWKDGRVRIKLDQIPGLAASTAVRRTLADRRRRFRVALASEMAKVGFVNRRDESGGASPYVFEPAESKRVRSRG